MIRWGNNDVACLAKTETGSGAIAYALGVGDRLATYTGGSYSYDTAGCVTAIDRTGKPDLDLTWSGQYQLTSVSTNGIVAESYTYDPFGRRASTTSVGTTIRHVYDGIHCVADIDSVGRVVKSYTWGPGVDNLLAVTCHSGTLATTYYALTDLQGTVHGFADAGGNLVARYAYDAWGNLLDADVAVSALADNRFLFQGREYSWATGLTNFRLRWYDPATGRWISKDPIGISGGLNLYAFCNNDPVNFRDPWGLCEAGSDDYNSLLLALGTKQNINVNTAYGELSWRSPIELIEKALKEASSQQAKNELRGLLKVAKRGGRGGTTSVRMGGSTLMWLPGLISDVEIISSALGEGKPIFDAYKDTLKNALPFLITPIGVIPNAFSNMEDEPQMPISI